MLITDGDEGFLEIWQQVIYFEIHGMEVEMEKAENIQKV